VLTQIITKLTLDT